MSIRNLDKIFDPHRIAVIGANETPTSVGYTVFRNLIASNFRGVVYPVNPEAARRCRGSRPTRISRAFPPSPIWP